MLSSPGAGQLKKIRLQRSITIILALPIRKEILRLLIHAATLVVLDFWRPLRSPVSLRRLFVLKGPGS